MPDKHASPSLSGSIINLAWKTTDISYTIIKFWYLEWPSPISLALIAPLSRNLLQLLGHTLICLSVSH